MLVMKLLHAYPFTFWEGKAFWAHPTSIFDLFLMVWSQQVIYSSLNSCHNFLSTTNHFWQAITFWHWHMKQAFLKLLGKVLVALLIWVREKSPSHECGLNRGVPSALSLDEDVVLCVQPKCISGIIIIIVVIGTIGSVANNISSSRTEDCRTQNVCRKVQQVHM